MINKKMFGLIQEIQEQKELSKRVSERFNLDSNLVSLELTQDEVEYICGAIGLRAECESLEEERLYLLRKFIQGEVNLFSEEGERVKVGDGYEPERRDKKVMPVSSPNKEPSSVTQETGVLK